MGPRGAHGRRQRRRRPRAGLFAARRPHAGHDGGRLPGRCRGIVPVALLPGDVERGTVERPGTDGHRARDLRTLESRAVLLGLVALRWGDGPGPRAPVDRLHVELLPLQCGALRADPRTPHLELVAAPYARRRSRRADHLEMTRPPLVEIRGMTKRFGALTALDDVSLRLEPGTFHAILGENGAGKSTLVKCMMGYHRTETGHLLLDGREQRVSGPRHAHRLGLGMVYQHFTLVPSMTVAENLVLGRDDLGAVVRWGDERARMRAFLEAMPFRIELDRSVASLAAGEKQKVEILKQLFLGRRVLILDEPTSVLTPEEADQILGV